MSLKEAADIEKTSNHLEWKKFFQKIGSNPKIKDKTVSIRWGELWDFTASAVGGKGFGENQSAILASAKSLHILNSEQVTTGARGETRTLKSLRPQHFKCCVYAIPPPGLDEFLEA